MNDARKRKPWLSIFCAIIALLLMYMPSYALYLRWFAGPSKTDHIPFYTPVEWLIDDSRAKQPLMWWAAVCGVREQTELSSIMRQLRELLEKTRKEDGIWQLTPGPSIRIE